MTNHIRHVRVELAVLASDEFSNEELARAVMNDVLKVERDCDYMLEDACAYTHDENEVDELEALREVCHIYAQQGIYTVERYINSDGAQ